MKHYSNEDIAMNVLAAREGKAGDAELGRHLAECADCREAADMLGALARTPASAAGCLSFDDLYQHHFGTPTAEHKAAVEGVLAECGHCDDLSRMFRGLPTEDQATAAALELPADLKQAVFAGLAVESRSESLVERLSAAAREFMESVREKADAFVMSISGLVRLARVSPQAELAYAYDGIALAEAPAPAALAALPRIKVEHGYLCLALAGETPGDVEVALVDIGGREVARAKPNSIGVVMFERISPGTYGVKVS